MTCQLKRDSLHSGRSAAAPARGMTLVEVLAVIVILGLLTATLTVGLSGSLGKGRRELARTSIALIAGKLDLYHLEYRDYPSMSVGLAALSGPHARPTAAYFVPPDSLRDPWGRAFIYVTPGPDEYPYEVISLGSDGASGGANDSADISSRRLGGRDQP